MQRSSVVQSYRCSCSCCSALSGVFSGWCRYVLSASVVSQCFAPRAGSSRSLFGNRSSNARGAKRRTSRCRMARGTQPRQHAGQLGVRGRVQRVRGITRVDKTVTGCVGPGSQTLNGWKNRNSRSAKKPMGRRAKRRRLIVRCFSTLRTYRGSPSLVW